MRTPICLVVLWAAATVGCASSTQTTVSSSGQSATAVHTAPKAASAQAGVRTLASGLKYEDLKIGDGPVAENGSTVSVHYTGWLTDHTKFDSSLDRGQPYTFVLGTGEVIRGWDEGIAGMRVGGRRRLTIPPDLAYADRGRGGLIPPNATLLFEVELVDVQ